MATAPDVLAIIAKAKAEKATFIDLGNCRLTRLPEELFDLTYLEGINLGRRYGIEGDWQTATNYGAYNQISDIRGLEKLTQLQTLFLNANQISDIRGLEKLTRLQSLYLGANQISDISGLEKLTQLQTLNLRNSQIAKASSIQLILALNPQLSLLYLDKGIDGIPEGLEESAQELRAYFDKRRKDKSFQPNHTLKLILLGNTRAGKSQLLNFLQKKPYKKKSVSTPGINIDLWLDPIEEAEYRLMCFDFGGQDFYHATHNLYLDSNSLYLTLWHPQVIDSGQHLPLGYWLGNIDYFTAGETSGNMAIWTIQSRADEGIEEGTDRIRESIPTEYGNLYGTDPEGQFYLSVQEAQSGSLRWLKEWEYFRYHLNRKIQELTRKAAPYTNETTQVRDILLPELRKEKRMVIERATFVVRCNELFKTKSNIDAYNYVLSVLRAAGELLWYREIEAAEPYLIIDPNAWSNFIFTVLDEDTRLKNGGEFSRAMIEEAIQESTVHAQDKEILPQLFLTLLQHYQIIFEKPGDEGHFVVPQYLPEPKITKNLQKLISLTFVVCYEHYMPFWRMANFISLKGADANLADVDYWRYGIIYEVSGCSVMVRVQRPLTTAKTFKQDLASEQKLFVHVEGPAEPRTKLLIDILDFFARVYSFDQRKDSPTEFKESQLPLEARSRYKEERGELFGSGSPATTQKPPFIKKIQFSTNDRDFFYVDGIEEGFSEKFIKSVTGKLLPIPALFYSIFNQKNAMPKRIFFSYAHADAQYRRELETHFAALKRGQFVETWHDLEILPGSDWHERIMEEMDKADLVIALISPDFMNSSYIWEKEIPKMGKKFVPIFLRPCDFDQTLFAPVQGLPGQPEGSPKKGIAWIVSSNWTYRDEAYLAVIDGLKKIL